LARDGRASQEANPLFRSGAAPDALFLARTPTGREYDSGDYATALDRARDAIGYDKVRDEQRRRRRAGGAPLGIGIASYVERSGGPPDSEEYGSVEIQPNGNVVGPLARRRGPGLRH